MKMIPQPYQPQQGGGIIIQQRNAIKTAANDPSIKGALPSHCQTQIDIISAKALADWSASEAEYMASMPLVAVHC